MKFGFRTPSLSKRIAARLSVKRMVRHNLGLKAPRGWGWLTNPKRAAYNRVYNRTSRGCLMSLSLMVAIPIIISALLLCFSACSQHSESKNGWVYVKPSVDYKGKFRKGHVRKPYNLRKDAYKSRARSSYYYNTRGKYRRKND